METTPFRETIGGDGPTTPGAYDPVHDPSRARTQCGGLEAASALWTGAGVLLRWKWFILVMTFLTGGAAVYLALQMDNWYGATARVLPPEGGGGGGLSGLIGDLSPLASSVLGGGGGGGDYTRYLAILTSRSMLDTVVEEFDLVDAYDLADEEYPQAKARTQLYEENLAFEVDLEYEFLSISAYDTDPQRAAQMANFMVDELNRRNEALGVEGAGRYRRYVEGRYREIEVAMDSARAEMQAFQERNGVVELPSTAQAFIEALAESRSRVAQAEVQYEAIAALGGPESAEVISASQALAAARRAQSDLEGGGESFMPIPLRRLPAAANEYAGLYQELLIQQALLETARPLFEQARFDEERDRVAVQVLDEAVPPTEKARPKRSLFVLSLTLAAGLLSSLFALLASWYRRNRDSLWQNLRAVS